MRFDNRTSAYDGCDLLCKFHLQTARLPSGSPTELSVINSSVWLVPSKC